MKQYFFILSILIISCSTKQVMKIPVDSENASSIKTKIDTQTSKAEVIETFSDSLNIGEKGKSKIEIIKHRVLDDTYVIVKFYTKRPKYWSLQNTYLYECYALMDLNANIQDFNNDKFNDITFISGTAARGANEVRRLFIYDDKEKQLISIINSENYPNMLYNDKLNCIDAFLVYGGTSTVFLKIEKDSLAEFASVNSSDGNRTVYEIDKFGKEKLIRNDTLLDEDDIYIRYKNFNPIEKYKE